MKSRELHVDFALGAYEPGAMRSPASLALWLNREEARKLIQVLREHIEHGEEHGSRALALVGSVELHGEIADPPCADFVPAMVADGRPVHLIRFFDCDDYDVETGEVRPDAFNESAPWRDLGEIGAVGASQHDLEGPPDRATAERDARHAARYANFEARCAAEGV